MYTSSCVFVHVVKTDCSLDNGECDNICVVSQDGSNRQCLCQDNYKPSTTMETECKEGKDTLHLHVPVCLYISTCTCMYTCILILFFFFIILLTFSILESPPMIIYSTSSQVSVVHLASPSTKLLTMDIAARAMDMDYINQDLYWIRLEDGVS